jgi:D-alanyl-D-alanine dipeptidase
MNILFIFGLLLVSSQLVLAEQDWQKLLASGQLVEVAKADPSIRIELRYAIAQNGVGVPLYPADLPAMVRPEVAARLQRVQRFLREQGRGLKIWDAYRPVETQRALWKRLSDRRFVADPKKGAGSYHTQGLSVDVTLVDAEGKEVAMPTDFDVFTSAASGWAYQGKDAHVRANLRLLQFAMMKVGGFQGLTTEWWHFTARDWKDFKPFDAAR